jgi:hypothetical protein
MQDRHDLRPRRIALSGQLVTPGGGVELRPFWVRKTPKKDRSGIEKLKKAVEYYNAAAQNFAQRRYFYLISETVNILLKLLTKAGLMINYSIRHSHILSLYNERNIFVKGGLCDGA